MRTSRFDLPFRRFTYITNHSPTLLSLHLSHNSFYNSSVASPTHTHCTYITWLAAHELKLDKNDVIILKYEQQSTILFLKVLLTINFLSVSEAEFNNLLPPRILVQFNNLKESSSSSSEFSAQGQVFHCKLSDQGCSSAQRQVFHRKLRNHGCSFRPTRDKQVRQLPVAFRTPHSLQHLNKP